MSTPLPRSAAPPAVLLVEDQAAILDLLAALLEPLPVLRARSGAEALELLQKQRPALITLDLVLPGPGMDGFELLEQLRRRPELDEVPVAVITAQADLAAQKRAYRSGASDFVAKPFSVDILEAKLRMWLRLSQRAALAHGLRDFSHEVKNPLTAIAAAAQVLCRDDADAALRRRLARAIEDESERTLRLIHTHLGGEPGPGPERTLMPHQLLEDVLAVNLPDARARARVHLSCPRPLPAVRVDPDRLRQMVLNLLDNAVAATEHGGEVFLDACYDESAVTLAVRDTGIGIPSELLPRIFEVGFTTRKGSARGLGLGITQRLCLAAGAEIRVESTPGQGSRFTLRLPR